MKRKIYNEIVKWKKESNGTTALIIEGAKNVGKSQKNRMNFLRNQFVI